MSDNKIIDILYGGSTTPLEFHYENLTAPPILAVFTIQDINYLNYIATSVKLAGNAKKRLKMIDDLMKFRGLSKLAGGTNRVVYYHPDIPGVVYKIAIDRVGLGDNPAEFKNQELIKPFCCKVFECSPCGTIASFERVDRITSFLEFYTIKDDIYDLITKVLIGKYVLDDIGIDYFMNYGIRKSFGPVILDFPYIFELDGAKLYCNNILPNGKVCRGEIDYDAGFNNLVCTKCGKKYNARELSKPQKERKIQIVRNTGAKNMKITVSRGDKVLRQIEYDNEIKHLNKPTKFKNRTFTNDPIKDEKNIIKMPSISVVRGSNSIVNTEKEKHIKTKEFESKLPIVKVTRVRSENKNDVEKKSDDNNISTVEKTDIPSTKNITNVNVPTMAPLEVRLAKKFANLKNPIDKFNDSMNKKYNISTNKNVDTIPEPAKESKFKREDLISRGDNVESSTVVDDENKTEDNINTNNEDGLELNQIILDAIKEVNSTHVKRDKIEDIISNDKEENIDTSDNNIDIHTNDKYDIKEEIFIKENKDETQDYDTQLNIENQVEEKLNKESEDVKDNAEPDVSSDNDKSSADINDEPMDAITWSSEYPNIERNNNLDDTNDHSSNSKSNYKSLRIKRKRNKKGKFKMINDPSVKYTSIKGDKRSLKDVINEY